MKRLVDKFAFRISHFAFRNASLITKFEFRNSKSETPQPLKGNAGFTLIEVIIVIILIGATAGVLIHPLRQGVEGFVTVQNRGELTSEAREATTRMVREIRNIQRKGNNTPNIDCTTAGDEPTVSRIRFVDVVDNDIKFYLSGSNVQRKDMNTSADNILVDQVSSLQFRYFNGSNAELTPSPALSAAQCDNVRRILVTLALQDGGETITVTGQAFLRALTGV